MSQDTTLLITTEISSLPKYYLPSIAAWFGSLAIGTIVGYTSPGIPSIEDIHSHLQISKSSENWLGSLMPLGASLGALIAAVIVDKLGRKFTLMLASIPCVFGWLIMAYAINVYVLLIGRFATGLSVGFISMSAPLYIAETSSPKTRGFFGSGFQLWVTIGVFLVYLKGIYLPWSWLAVSNTIYPI
ncbi:facilitated trehalose transporter Tret1-like protein, partial [Leptotrombidium deliense]